MQAHTNPPAWRLQDAKAQFSSVVEFALRGVPQHVTRRGKQAVVILSEQDFSALQRSAQIAAPSFIAHLLAMPKSPDAAKRKASSTKTKNLAPQRPKLTLREVDFP
jgi:antitoxin Phd